MGGLNEINPSFELVMLALKALEPRELPLPDDDFSDKPGDEPELDRTDDKPNQCAFRSS